MRRHCDYSSEKDDSLPSLYGAHDRILRGPNTETLTLALTMSTIPLN